jgi:hypothetical protein
VDTALRAAHRELTFVIDPPIPVTVTTAMRTTD